MERLSCRRLQAITTIMQTKQNNEGTQGKHITKAQQSELAEELEGKEQHHLTLIKQHKKGKSRNSNRWGTGDVLRELHSLSSRRGQ